MFFVCFYSAHNIQNNGRDKFIQQILSMVKIKLHWKIKLTLLPILTLVSCLCLAPNIQKHLLLFLCSFVFSPPKVSIKKIFLCGPVLMISTLQLLNFLLFKQGNSKFNKVMDFINSNYNWLFLATSIS